MNTKVSLEELEKTYSDAKENYSTWCLFGKDSLVKAQMAPRIRDNIDSIAVLLRQHLKSNPTLAVQRAINLKLEEADRITKLLWEFEHG